MLSIHLVEDFDIPTNAHYISWATESGLTWAFDYTMRTLNLDYACTMTMFQKINCKDEVTTFYPQAPITIMPYDAICDDKTIYSNFNNALKIQNTQVKADTVVFDMRNYEYDHPRKNEEYIDMIIHAYRQSEIIKRSDANSAVENWIILCLGNVKISGLASQYVK